MVGQLIFLHAEVCTILLFILHIENFNFFFLSFKYISMLTLKYFYLQTLSARPSLAAFLTLGILSMRF